MTLVLNRVSLDGMMELTGEIDFPARKIVVIYGSNQQGKTNVINAIRYAFLKDTFGRAGRTKIEYDERRLPGRDELIFGEHAGIDISFKYNSVGYTLHRSIQSKGRRETSTLYKDGTNEPLPVGTFLRTRLKVSLLDALFAPEIAQGFKQLYSGDIDEAVSQMFKEITTLRELANAFKVRLDRAKLGADAQRALIQASYGDFCGGLVKTAPTISNVRGFEQLRKFEAGKIFQKLDSFDGEVQKVVARLKEEGLIAEIDDAITKSNQLSEIKKGLSKQESITRNLKQLKDVEHDSRVLTAWVRSTSSIKNLDGELKPTPKLRDQELLSTVTETASEFAKAKGLRNKAAELARKERVRIEDISDILSGISKVIRLLTSKTKVGKEVPASMTKIGDKVYTIVPLKLLEKDHAFSEISRQPIPTGSRSERDRHVKLLKERQDRLKGIQRTHNESERLFDTFVKDGIDALNGLLDGLGTRKTASERSIKNWSDGLSDVASSFTHKKARRRSITNAKDVDLYAKAIQRAVASAIKRHLASINRSLRDLSIKVTHLEQAELTRIRKQVLAQKQELPQLEEVESDIATKKVVWSSVDEEYSDYLQMPRIVDDTTAVLEQILSKCFDEAMLREKVVETYNEIIKLMQERRLIQATAEIGPEKLKSVVLYKGKAISHPAGSEKSFFSLAILTALAHYFQTPVLIDEVANNLDSRNLKAFFQLANEFKDRYSVQYVLSIKQTNDFELNGWVRELRDDIAVHEISDKNIQTIQL